MLCAIWYHLYKLKNIKNAHARSVSKSNTSPREFFTFFKSYQMAQRITY